MKCMHCGSEFEMTSNSFVCGVCVTKMATQNGKIGMHFINDNERNYNLGEYKTGDEYKNVGKVLIDAFWTDAQGHRPIIDEVDISNIKEIAKSPFKTARKPALCELAGARKKVFVGGFLDAEFLPSQYKLPVKPDFSTHENNLVRLPSRHTWDSKLSIYQFEEINSDIPLLVEGLYADIDGKLITLDDIPKNKRGKEGYTPLPYIKFPLPVGTPYIVRYFKTEDDGSVFFGTYSNVTIDTKYNHSVIVAMSQLYWHNFVPKLGKSLNTHMHHVGEILIEKINNILVTLFPGDVKHSYTPITCECGGHFKADLMGVFYCLDCGMEYLDAFGMPVEDDGEESFFDNLDDTDSTMASLYQGEQDIGSLLPPAMNRIEARLTRNIEAWRSAISTASSDELKAKMKYHERAENTRAAKKAMRKTISKKSKEISVYDSKASAKKKSFRCAAILAWIKDLKQVTSSELRATLDQHNTPINAMEFMRLLEKLATDGRITMVKQENVKGSTNIRQPYILTYIH